MGGSRLVIGVGGTGRTHTLRAWADGLSAEGRSVVWLVGSPAVPIAAAQVSAAAADGAVIVADDVQWFDPDAARSLLDAAAGSTIVLASRRPSAPGTGPGPDLLDALDEVLGRDQPATRIGMLAVEDFAAALSALRAQAGVPGAQGAMATDEINAVHDLSGGSVAFAADLIAAGWDRTGEPPTELVDAVTRRVRRAGPQAAVLAEAWALAATIPDVPESPLETALRALPDDIDPDAAEREARAGGLVGPDDRLLPLVERALIADLTAGGRAAWHDRLGAALAAVDPLGAARHFGFGSGTAPGAVEAMTAAAAMLSGADGDESAILLDRAEQLGLAPITAAVTRGVVAFHHGAPDALAHLDRAARLVGDDPDSAGRQLGDIARLGYGLDMRELRFDDARSRSLTDADADALAALAGLFTGRPVEAEGAPGNGTSDPGGPDRDETPVVRMLATMADGLASVAQGRTPEAIAALASAADDHDRLEPSGTFGLTPHQAGALAAIALGDQPAAVALATQGVANTSGGPGEAFTHELLRAYAALMGGDYQPTLAVLRANTATPATDGSPVHAGDADSAVDAAASTNQTVTQRDRLLLSALEAAVARRSGDTGRLRAAWNRAEEALLRGTASWLFADFLIEILACGARLGDVGRIEPVVAAITEQGARMPETGPGPVSAAWLKLQVAIASDDAATVGELASAVAVLKPVDRRSQARVAAAAIWADVMTQNTDELSVTAVAEELVACGEAWEASRLLGQAALDEPDPQVARRLLERARATGVEAVDEGEGGGLASLGLSDREAEVAILVVEGRTHKEIGAQLYISPKTVEHHVAKIRQKVGAGSRAELLSIVREALG